MAPGPTSIRYNRLTLPVPAGWEDGTQVIVAGPPDSSFRANVVLTHLVATAGETAAQIAARQLGPVMASVDQFVLVEEGPAVHGTFTGFQREQQFSAGGKLLQQLQFWAVVSGTVYTFTYSDLASRFATGRVKAEQIFASAKLE